LATGESVAASKVDQTYYTPYLAHAPIEPHAAVVSIQGTQATVWASTQCPFAVRSSVAGILGFSSSNVRVITPYVGGGFGGKAAYQQALEAARIAKAVGKPVNLAWTREEEFFCDTFQPASITKIRAGIDQNKRISFFDAQIYCVGSRGATIFYEIPHYRLRTYGNWDSQGSHPFAVGPWRAPGNNANTFARESQIDMLAVAAGLDALEFRLLHLQTVASARMRKVLQKAAESFGWQPAPAPSGRGYGVACGEDAGAYVAMMAQVEVDMKTGAIRVLRMLCAQDMGQVINPEGARMQMEGSMMMGLGYSLGEELCFQQGRIETLNFDTYPIPRFAWMPKLETVFVENNSLAPQGGGEPSIITTGAVIANAVFDAVGVRANRLPMTRERILALVQALPLALNTPERAGDQVRLSWNGRPGVKLQSSPSLTQPVWQDVPNTEGQSSLTLQTTNNAAFFRLMKP
jgi:isoquinoline 1-oxidoreductase